MYILNIEKHMKIIKIFNSIWESNVRPKQRSETLYCAVEAVIFLKFNISRLFVDHKNNPLATKIHDIYIFDIINTN